jgi:transcriptional regulator with XRE-family HTH domain
MPNSFANILGDKIKEAREKAGFTQEDLAKQACLSSRQLEQIESGGAPASILRRLNWPQHVV